MSIQTEVVKGRPLRVGSWRLVPVVRRTSGVRRKATIGTDHHSAWGGGFVRLHPLGLVAQQGEKEGFIPIPDRTGQMLLGLLAAALVVPLLLILAARLARR
jgi:hypothetical protein